MRFSNRWLPPALCFGLASLASVASAEPLPSVDTQHFKPPTSPDGTLYLESSKSPGAGEWNLGSLFSWNYRPVVLRDSDGELAAKLIRHQLSLNLLGSIGVTDFGAIGLSVPAVLLQQGDTGPTEVVDDSTLPKQALGDIALTAKATVIPYELGGFGLAALARVTLPTGARTSFLGEGAFTSELRFLAEYNLIAASLQATTGFKLRVEERSFAGETWGNEIPWGIGLVVLPRAFGIDEEGRWRWAIEAYGALPAGPEKPFTRQALSPAIFGASTRYELTPNLFLTTGIEAPLDSAVGVPLTRFIAGLSWAPRSHVEQVDSLPQDFDEFPELPDDFEGFDVSSDRDRDGIADSDDACPDIWGVENEDRSKHGCPVLDRDGDGIADDVDMCPDEPEDIDGFRDEDGCPDPDHDGDGIPDTEDSCPNIPGPASQNPKQHGCPIPDRDGDTIDDEHDECPLEPETWNGFKDDDGCPDVGGMWLARAVEAGPSIQVRKKIRFEGPLGAQTIHPDSVSTIRAIATLLNQHPEWVLAVGSQPNAAEGPLASSHALSRSFAVVLALQSYTSRDGVTETVGWEAVKSQPGAQAHGIGFLVLDATPNPDRTPEPVDKED